MANSNNGNNRGGRGFASMDEDRQREIASMGGKASHQGGRGNQFTSDSGREAGRKGGQSRQGNNQGGQSNEGEGMEDMSDQ